MARTWRTERTTPKKPPQQAPVRPRVNEFAKQWYEDHGYQVEDTVTRPITGPEVWDAFDKAWAKCVDEARGYLEADA